MGRKRSHKTHGDCANETERKQHGIGTGTELKQSHKIRKPYKRQANDTETRRKWDRDGKEKTGGRRDSDETGRDGTEMERKGNGNEA